MQIIYGPYWFSYLTFIHFIIIYKLPRLSHKIYILSINHLEISVSFGNIEIFDVKRLSSS